MLGAHGSLWRMAAKKKAASKVAKKKTPQRSAAKKKTAQKGAAAEKTATKGPARKKPAKKAAKKSTAKKEAAQSTAKTRAVSREKEKPVALAGPSARAALVGHLKELVKRTVADADERPRWRMPVYSLGEEFCYVSWSPRGVSLGFFRGTELPDPEGLLQGVGRHVRVVRIRAVEEIREAPLRRLIKAAAELAAG